MSETNICRTHLERYCLGIGLDLGCGDDLIVPWAIGVDTRQLGYTSALGDVTALNKFFQSGSMDFVFSSHCLEDFNDTVSVLRHWISMLRTGGYLVLYLPDQKRYMEHCKANGVLPNQNHKNPEFSLEYVQLCLNVLGNTLTVFAKDPLPEYSYSFGLVVQKVDSSWKNLQP
jgi:predicted SAM-dependent methyltransferase